jgi:hypothetical protein
MPEGVEMSDQSNQPADQPTLDDVMEPHEQAIRHPREHAKADPRPNDDALEHRAEQEREIVREEQGGS